APCTGGLQHFAVGGIREIGRWSPAGQTMISARARRARSVTKRRNCGREHADTTPVHGVPGSLDVGFRPTMMADMAGIPGMYSNSLAKGRSQLKALILPGVKRLARNSLPLTNQAKPPSLLNPFASATANPTPVNLAPKSARV